MAAAVVHQTEKYQPACLFLLATQASQSFQEPPSNRRARMMMLIEHLRVRVNAHRWKRSATPEPRLLK